MLFAIKAEVSDPQAETFAFNSQKTMYRGKQIAKGDMIFVFASENEDGPGLIASGVVTFATAISKKARIARQTPRVSITVKRTALAKRALGRSELKSFSNWSDGRPETELNFKFYRQATNKIVAISDEAAAFLHGFFDARLESLPRPMPFAYHQITGIIIQCTLSFLIHWRMEISLRRLSPLRAAAKCSRRNET